MINNNDTVKVIQILTIFELPLNHTVTHEIINSQYKNLAKIYHPDVANSRYSDGTKFKELKEAQEYLLANINYVNRLIISGFSSSSSNSFSTTNSYYEEQKNQEEERKRQEEFRKKEEERKRKEEAEKKRKEEEEQSINKNVVNSEIFTPKKARLTPKMKTFIISICIFVLIIFGILGYIKHTEKLNMDMQMRDFEVLVDRYFSYMDSSNSWTTDSNDHYISGDIRAFTIGTPPGLITFDRKDGDKWVIVNVLPGNKYRGYYGTNYYYDCEITDIDGVVTVSFSENFPNMSVAIDQITALFLVIRNVDINSQSNPE